MKKQKIYTLCTAVLMAAAFGGILALASEGFQNQKDGETVIVEVETEELLETEETEGTQAKPSGTEDLEKLKSGYADRKEEIQNPVFEAELLEDSSKPRPEELSAEEAAKTALTKIGTAFFSTIPEKAAYVVKLQLFEGSRGETVSRFWTGDIYFKDNTEGIEEGKADFYFTLDPVTGETITLNDGRRDYLEGEERQADTIAFSRKDILELSSSDYWAERIGFLNTSGVLTPKAGTLRDTEVTGIFENNIQVRAVFNQGKADERTYYFLFDYYDRLPHYIGQGQVIGLGL